MIPLVNILRSRWDTDALDYLRRSAAADGQPSTPERMIAVNELVKALKGTPSPVAGVSNWQAMKATCLLAGARTLAGALVPLRGPAPTNYNFVSGDYDSTTGLQGDGASKYLDSNLNNTSLPYNNRHLAVYNNYVTFNDWMIDAGGLALNSSALVVDQNARLLYRLNSRTNNGAAVSNRGPGLFGLARQPDAAADVEWLLPDGAGVATDAGSTDPFNGNLTVFFRSTGTYSRDKFSFYSIGEAVDLVALRSAINVYMEAIS